MSRNVRWETRPIGRGRPDSHDINISFLLGQLRNSDDAKKEDQNITLDDLAVQFTQMGLAEWSDVSAGFIRAVNYVLDRSDFEVR